MNKPIYAGDKVLMTIDTETDLPTAISLPVDKNIAVLKRLRSSVLELAFLGLKTPEREELKATLDRIIEACEKSEDNSVLLPTKDYTFVLSCRTLSNTLAGKDDKEILTPDEYGNEELKREQEVIRKYERIKDFTPERRLVRVLFPDKFQSIATM